MANLTAITTTVSIDGSPSFPCEVRIEQDVEMVRSELATKPDPAWEQTDTNGHFHAFGHDGTLPTLDAEQVEMPCNGSCGGVCGGEGYFEARYTCRICGEEIEPNWVPDFHARNEGTPVVMRKSADLVVRTGGLVCVPGKAVSLRVHSGDRELIGIGDVTGLNSDGEIRISARSLEPRLAR